MHGRKGFPHEFRVHHERIRVALMLLRNKIPFALFCIGWELLVPRNHGINRHECIADATHGMRWFVLGEVIRNGSRRTSLLLSARNVKVETMMPFFHLHRHSIDPFESVREWAMPIDLQVKIRQHTHVPLHQLWWHHATRHSSKAHGFSQHVSRLGLCWWSLCVSGIFSFLLLLLLFLITVVIILIFSRRMLFEKRLHASSHNGIGIFDIGCHHSGFWRHDHCHLSVQQWSLGRMLASTRSLSHSKKNACFSKKKGTINFTCQLF
jgi:hypothetical protein